MVYYRADRLTKRSQQKKEERVQVLTMMLFGYIVVLLNVVNVISSVTDQCYPVNGREYCFHTNRSVLNWEEARGYCASRNSTLPIITDKDIDNVFQRYIVDNQVSSSNTEQMSNYVWLDALGLRVDESVDWHWINGQPSALQWWRFVPFRYKANTSVASIGESIYMYYQQPRFRRNNWTDTLSYMCQYHSNCTSTWVRRDTKVGRLSDLVYYPRASTATQCQQACEFDHRCVAFNWYNYSGSCRIIIDPNYRLAEFPHATLYELVSRCNTSTETSCENGFTYNSTCYKIHNESVNWFTAVNRCLSNNGSLAVFDDQILEYFTGSLLSEGPYWIGLIKSWWTWPDAGDADVLYNNFNVTASTPPENPPAQPNSDYNCVVATRDYWRVSQCTVKHRVVCQSVGPLTTTETTASTTTKSELTSHSNDGTLTGRFSSSTTRGITISTVTSTNSSQPSIGAGETDESQSGLTTTVLVAIVVAVVVIVAIVVLVIVVVVFVVLRRSRRSGQKPKQRAAPLPTSPVSPTSSNSVDASKHDVVYAHIERGPKPATDNADLHPRNTSESDDDAADAVMYSEIQRNDVGAHTAAPSGGMYTEVQKR